jgi:hypothetical protein
MYLCIYNYCGISINYDIFDSTYITFLKFFIETVYDSRVLKARAVSCNL